MVDQLIIMGPAWPLRGNLAAFDEKLAQSFMQASIKTKLYTFSLQYPNFLFPGSTQYSTDPAPKGLSIEVAINSINPFNWIKVGLKIKNERPNLIIVRYWIPFLAPALGTILSIVKWNKCLPSIKTGFFKHSEKTDMKSKCSNNKNNPA